MKTKVEFDLEDKNFIEDREFKELLEKLQCRRNDSEVSSVMTRIMNLSPKMSDVQLKQISDILLTEYVQLGNYQTLAIDSLIELSKQLAIPETRLTETLNILKSSIQQESKAENRASKIEILEQFITLIPQSKIVATYDFLFNDHFINKAEKSRKAGKKVVESLNTMVFDPDKNIDNNIKHQVIELLKRNSQSSQNSITKLEEKFSDFASEYNKNGLVLEDLKKYDEALAAYDNAIALKPKYTSAYDNKGMTLAKLSRYDEALVAYDRAIELNPDYASAHKHKGDALYALSRTEEALVAYDRAIELNPDYASAYDKKGDALNALKRYDEALVAYDHAISLSPDNAYAHKHQGDAFNALNRHEEALVAYDRALSLNPDYSSAHDNKERILKALNKYAEALLEISQTPEDSSAYKKKGSALEKLNRYEEALIAYDQAIKTDQKYADAYFKKGNVLRRYLNRNEEAIEAYDVAIELEPRNTKYYNNKGHALESSGRNEEALAVYNRAIELAENNDAALYYCCKARVLKALGREIEALECYDKAYGISINSSDLNTSSLSMKNIKHINKALTNDRGALLLKLKSLQETSIATQNIVDTLDATDPVVKSAVEKFKTLKQAKTELTDQAIDSLDDQKVNKDQAIAHADNQSLLEQLTIQTNLMLQMQTQMLQLQAEAKQLRDRVDIHDIVQADLGSRINLTEENLTKLASDLGLTKEEIKTHQEEFKALASLVATHDHRIKAGEDYLVQMGDVTGAFDQIKRQIEQNSSQFTESLAEQNRKLEKLSTEVSNLSKMSVEVMNLTDRVNAQEGRLIEVYQRFDEYEKKLVSLDSIVEEINVNNEAISKLQAEMLANKKLLDQFSDSNKNGKGEFNNDALAELTERLNAKMLEADQNISLLQEKVLEHETTLEIVSNLVPQIKGLLVREEQSQKAASELEVIYSDPYKESFYEVMRWELNTVYLAAMVVQTDIVKSSKSGSVGKIGKLISSISSHIPMVGAGVSLLGYILESVDEVHQKTIIARYASLVPDAVEMSTLAKQVSQALVSNDAIKRSLESSGASTSAFTKFTQILGDIAIEFAQNGLSSAVSKLTYYEIGSIVSGGVGNKAVISQAKRAVISSASGVNGLSAADVTLTIGRVVVDDTIDDLYVQNTANNKPSFKERFQKLNPFKNTKKEEKASEKTDNIVQDATKMTTTEEDNDSLIARQAGLRGERDATEISKFIIAKIFKEGAGGGDISSKANFIVKYVRVEYGLVLEDEMATAISSDLDSLSIGGPEEQTIEIRQLSTISYDNPILNETKLLSAAHATNSAKVVSDLINLGQDQEMAITLIEASREQGPEHIIRMIFGTSLSTDTNTEQVLCSTSTDIIPSYQQLDSSNLVGES